jgi:hypothetical protein
MRAGMRSIPDPLDSFPTNGHISLCRNQTFVFAACLMQGRLDRVLGSWLCVTKIGLIVPPPICQLCTQSFFVWNAHAFPFAYYQMRWNRLSLNTYCGLLLNNHGTWISSDDAAECNSFKRLCTGMSFVGCYLTL